MMDVIGLTCGCGSKKISKFYWDISGQVVELKKSSAGDGFLGAGWSVAGLKFDAGQGGGGGRSLLYISCIVPTNPPEQPAQCDVPRRSLKISTARTGPAEAVELCAQRALHSLRPFLLVCRQMIYMARRNQTRPRWVRKGQLGAEVSHHPPGQSAVVLLERPLIAGSCFATTKCIRGGEVAGKKSATSLGRRRQLKARLVRTDVPRDGLG